MAGNGSFHSSNTRPSKLFITVSVPFFILLAVLIVVANGLIIIIFCRRKERRNSICNKLICNQASIDLLTALMLGPLLGISPHGIGIIDYYCRPFLLLLSIFSLSSLAIDRFIATYKPLKYKQICTNSFLKKEILLIWIMPLLILIVPIVEYATEANLMAVDLFAHSFLIIWFVVIITVNVLVYRIAKQNVSNRRAKVATNVAERHRLEAELLFHQAELRITILFALIIVSFIATYTPIVVISFYLASEQELGISDTLITVTTAIFTSNSLINPILCFWWKEDFRKDLKGLVRKETVPERANRGSNTISKDTSV